MADWTESATEYLRTGGLGEVIGFTSIAHENGEMKVQMDTDMAMALCLLADQTLKAEKIKAFPVKAHPSAETLKAAREFLPELLTALETDCGIPDEFDGDDEGVASTLEVGGDPERDQKPSALTFGHLRRLREIVGKLGAT